MYLLSVSVTVQKTLTESSMFLNFKFLISLSFNNLTFFTLYKVVHCRTAVELAVSFASGELPMSNDQKTRFSLTLYTQTLLHLQKLLLNQKYVMVSCVKNIHKNAEV